MMVKLGFSKRPENYEPDPTFEDAPSVVCNSFNVALPEKKYPENTDLSHDGVYIWLLCQSADGKEIRVNYWGD